MAEADRKSLSKITRRKRDNGNQAFEWSRVFYGAIEAPLRSRKPEIFT